MLREGMLTFARLRPLNGDVDHRRRVAYEVHRAAADNEEITTLQLQIPEEQRTTFGNRRVARYKFTGVLEEDASQQDVYEAVALDTVSACLRGFSGTIFAYGQTSSGKTWTVTGGETFKDRGIAPRAIGQLFGKIREAESRGLPVRYRVLAYYLEIYENRVHDLLDVSNRGKPLEEWATVSLRSDGEGNQVLRGLTSFEVDNEEDTLNLFFMGNSHRVMGETPTNRASSRSHAIFTLAISSEREEESALGGGVGVNRNNEEINTIISRGELNLVDLAGCERMYKNDRHGYSVALDDDAAVELMGDAAGVNSVSASAQGRRKATRKREGANINLSLTKLERVILALKKPDSFVPYRECALTSVLRRSLGVRCRTVFVINLSVGVEDLPETIASCRFAQNCRKVVCRPVADEGLNPGQELRLLRRETADMRTSLAVKEDLVRVLTEEIRVKQLELEATTEQLEALETTQAFHTKRSLTKEDKEACAVLTEALANGSDEASEALEGLDRVSALQCCRELQAILLLPPSSSPMKSFVDVTASASPQDEEFQDWEANREEGGREEVVVKSEHRSTRDEGEYENMKHLFAGALGDNAQLLVETRRLRDQNQTLEALLQQRDTTKWNGERIQHAGKQQNGVSHCPASGSFFLSSGASPSAALSAGTTSAAAADTVAIPTTACGIWSDERAARDGSVSPECSFYEAAEESSLLKPMDVQGIDRSDDGRRHTSTALVEYPVDASAGISVGAREGVDASLGVFCGLSTTNDDGDYRCVFEGDDEERQGDKQDGQNSRKDETGRWEDVSEDKKVDDDREDSVECKCYDDFKGEEADEKEGRCGEEYIWDNTAPREATGRTNANTARPVHVPVLAAPKVDSSDDNSSKCRPLASGTDFLSTTSMEDGRRDNIEEGRERGIGRSGHRSAKRFTGCVRADCGTPTETKEQVLSPQETDDAGNEGQTHSHVHRGRSYTFEFDPVLEMETQETGAEKGMRENPGTDSMIARGREGETDTMGDEAQVEVDSSTTTAVEEEAAQPVVVVDEQKPWSNPPPSRGTRQLVGDFVRRDRPPLVVMSGLGQKKNDEGVSKVVNPSVDSVRHSAQSSRRGSGRGGGGGGIDKSSGGEEVLPRASSENEVTEKVPQEHFGKQRTLRRGGFFVMRGRFGLPRVRFVWMSTDLRTIFWRRGGRTEVLGSRDMSLFDSVHLESTKKVRHLALKISATATTAEKPADDAMNHHIVFIGPCGRHRLLLEVDLGESEPAVKQAELETWYEAFKYAIRVTHAGVVEQIRQSTKEPKSTGWAAIRSSFNGAARRANLNSASSISIPLYATAPATINLGTNGRGAPRRSTAPVIIRSTKLTSRGTRHHALDPSPTSSPPLSSTKVMMSMPKQCPTKKGGGRTSSYSSNISYNREPSREGNAPGGKTGRLAFLRPAPIDTSNLIGGFGLSSAPVRGKSGAPQRVLAVDDESHDREYEEAEAKKLASALATEAAKFVETSSLIQTGILTSLFSRDGTTATLPPMGSKERTWQPTVAPPTLFIDGPLETRELSSTWARDGRSRRLNTIGGEDDNGNYYSVYGTPRDVQRAWGGTFKIAQNRGRDGGVSGKGSQGNGIRRTRTSKPPSGDKSERSVGSVVSTVDHASWTSGLIVGLPGRTRGPLPRDGRRASTDFAKNLACRVPAPQPLGSLRQAEAFTCDGKGRKKSRISSSFSSSGVSRSLTDNAAVASTSRGMSSPLHDERDHPSSLSASQGLYRATARRLSALRAKALGGVIGGGESTSRSRSSSTNAKVGGARVLKRDSPGAKGDGSPPPPSREQHRRFSAAVLSERLMMVSQQSPPPARAAEDVVLDDIDHGALRRKSATQFGTWTRNRAVEEMERPLANAPTAFSSREAWNTGTVKRPGGVPARSEATFAVPDAPNERAGYSPAFVIGSPRARGAVAMV